MGRGANVHVIHFDWGGGQMSNTFFESGGKGGKYLRGQMSYTLIMPLINDLNSARIYGVGQSI